MSEHMRSTSQVDLLVQALCHHSNSSYSIVKIECYHKETEFAQHLLAGLPEHALQQLETLWLVSESHQPLPMCLPGLISRMNRLSYLAAIQGYRSLTDCHTARPGSSSHMHS